MRADQIDDLVIDMARLAREAIQYPSRRMLRDHTYEEISPMQKRHFERLASAVRRIRDDCENAEGSLTDKQIDTIVNEIADVCQQFGDNFNRTKFREACKK